MLVGCEGEGGIGLSVTASLERAGGHDHGTPEEGGPALRACALCTSFLGERGLLRSLASPPLQPLAKP